MKIRLIAFLSQVLILGLCATAVAQDNEQERRGKPVLSNNIYRSMNKAQEAIESEDYPAALQVLNDLLARGERLQGYDRAKTLHLKTIVFIRQEKYSEAVAACKQAIALRALEVATEQELRYTLVRMLFVLERYDEALEVLEDWLANTETLTADAAFTAAQLYLTVEQLPKAQTYAEQGMALHQADVNTSPRENWYRLLLSIYGQQQKYNLAANIAEQTLALWPGKFEYYQQLSGLYQQLDRQQEAWAIWDIAYYNDLFTQSDQYMRLLQLQRFFGYPYRGAVIVSEALNDNRVAQDEENWAQLANAWLQSRQWQAAETTLIAAAQLSDAGQHWLRLCQTATRTERWHDAIDYCDKAVDKGRLAGDRGIAWQLLAMSHYSTNNYSAAVNYFERCSQETQTREDCRNWLQHVNNFINFKASEQAHAERQARLAEERRRNRDSLIEDALLMTE